MKTLALLLSLLSGLAYAQPVTISQAVPPDGVSEQQTPNTILAYNRI